MIAALSIPDERVVDLPAGANQLIYQEQRRAPLRGAVIDFGVPGGLEIAVVSLSGVTLEIVRPELDDLAIGRGWSRALIGEIEVTEPGPHSVSAMADLTGAVEPELLVTRWTIDHV